MENKQFRFAIDRGGTFTDIYTICPNGKIRVMKLLSEDPRNYDDAPREGIRRILEEVTILPKLKRTFYHFNHYYHFRYCNVDSCFRFNI